MIKLWTGLLERAMVFKHTHDPRYITQRKEISSAFFKSKLLGMCKIIKEITMKEIKKLQESPNLDNFNMSDFTLSLQGRIIINILVGKGYSTRKLKWETANGQFTEVSIQDAMSMATQFALTRTQLPVNIVFPELMPYRIHGDDRREGRNAQRMRDFLLEII
jgi:cytochrome P450